MVLPNRSVFFRKSVMLRAMAFVRASKCHGPLEILGLVFFVGDFSPVAVEFALARPPAHGIVGRDDTMDAIGGKEAVVNSLPQAVGVDRVAEVGVGIGVCRRAAGLPSCRAGRQARSIREFPASCFRPGHFRDGIRPR